MVAVDDDGRFSFGENWLSFLEHLDERRIAEAERSLQSLCGLERLDGKRFLDIGSGSGLSSLAARRLGATVHSFDYDIQSVSGTRKLKDRFFPHDASWTVEQGSVLDSSYMARLGEYDIVYSWGVLHHTGAMHDAIRNAASCVNHGGLFVFALYRKTRLCRQLPPAPRRSANRWAEDSQSHGGNFLAAAPGKSRCRNEQPDGR